jgi:hypothetical protein
MGSGSGSGKGIKIFFFDFAKNARAANFLSFLSFFLLASDD